MYRRIYGFDLDGPIINSVPRGAAIFGRTIRERYVFTEIEGVRVEQFFFGTQGHPLENQYRTALDKKGITASEREVKELAEKYREQKYAVIDPLFPDVIPCFEVLRASGCGIYISTSMRQENLERVVDAHGLRKYLNLWLGTSSAVPKKSAHKQQIVQGFGVSEREFGARGAIIGDARRDMEIGREWRLNYKLYVKRYGWPAPYDMKDVIEISSLDPYLLMAKSELT